MDVRRKLVPAGQEPESPDEQEVAAWYDQHDTAELPGEEASDTASTDMSEAQPDAPLQTIAVRVSRRELAELKRRASRLGVGYTTYVRILINRHVLEEPPLGGASPSS